MQMSSGQPWNLVVVAVGFQVSPVLKLADRLPHAVLLASMQIDYATYVVKILSSSGRFAVISALRFWPRSLAWFHRMLPSSISAFVASSFPFEVLPRVLRLLHSSSSVFAFGPVFWARQLCRRG
ncbi:MAG: hypothetical protein J5818_05110, partial [Eggerthellaceae bacterium]|nr:hypothetical protein [Eggerthellaceae bacterium]